MRKKDRSVPIIFVLISLCLFTFSFLIGQASAQVRTELEKTNGWREIQFNFGTLEPPFFSWCKSSKQVILGGKGKKGITLLDILSGSIEEFTTNVRHKYPSCSRDGHYVFFTDGLSGHYKNLYVYDTRTKKVSTIYSLEEPLPVYIVREPVSPLSNYLIGPGNWKERVTLPGGEVVTVVPIYGAVEIGKPMEFFKLEWSPDAEKLFLLNSNEQILHIRDNQTKKELKIKLRIEGYKVMKVKASPNGRELYIYAGPEEERPKSSEKTVNLYVMELSNPEKLPRFLIKKVYDFDMDAEGTIIFSRVEEGFNTLYEKKKTNEAKLIKKFKSYPWDWPIIPYVSKDGKGIAFHRILETKEKVIVVLLKDD